MYMCIYAYTGAYRRPLGTGGTLWKRRRGIYIYMLRSICVGCMCRVYICVSPYNITYSINHLYSYSICIVV